MLNPNIRWCSTAIISGAQGVEYSLELERTRVDLQEALSTQPSADDGSKREAPPLDVQPTAGDPTATVLSSYAALEHELRRRLQEAGVEVPDGGSATQLAAIGAREGLFTESAVEAVKGVSVMRNLVAHGRADRVTPQEAAEYAALVDATLFTLRTKPKR